MGDIWIVDMTDYLLPDGQLAGGPAGRIAQYFGSIVSIASLQPTGVWVKSSIECRRRPMRKRCQGHIRLRRSDVPSRVEWHCTACGDNGLIGSWRRTRWDLSRPQDQLPPESMLQIAVNDGELQVLRDILFLGAESQAMVDGAIGTDNGFLIRGEPDDFADLAGYVAAEADHEADSQRRQVLDAVVDRIETVICEHGL